MINKITAQDVLRNCRETLRLPGDETELDEVLLAGMLRRCAGILCPCSRATLRSEMINSLNHLHTDTDSLADRLNDIIEGLIVYGDLLELSDVATVDPKVKSTWVFAAPPRYIVRPSGWIFLIGIVADQDVLLPESIATLVSYRGCTRRIKQLPDEQIEVALSAQGMQEISDSVWHQMPKDETAKNLLERCQHSLMAESRCGLINDLEILDSAKSVKYYRGRWASPKKQTGTFVARRPQEFGAPIWCFVQLKEGVPQRLIDLPLSRFRWRDCDAAWHLQMAIDHRRGQPQLYRRRETGNGIRFDFFSPLPQWFERRLLIFGHSLPREQCLISYELQSKEAENEERLLQKKLWLAPDNDQLGDKVLCR